MDRENRERQEDVANAKVVLVVEDDPDIGAFLVQAIQQETPSQAVLATDGQEALDLIQLFMPDALVLDYNLPAMTGIALYDSVRARTKRADIPALLITAFSFKCEKEARARHLPLLKKPFELSDLLNQVEQLLA